MKNEDKLSALRATLHTLVDNLLDIVGPAQTDVEQGLSVSGDDNSDPIAYPDSVWPLATVTEYDNKALISELQPLIGKKILDFGCYTGDLVGLISKEQAELIVGYDINVLSRDSGNIFITNDWHDVVNRGPYDMIILNDVLDHTVDKDAPLPTPIDILNACRTVCHEESKVFIRNHPWTSRNGGHMDHRINKAWLHLYLTPQEREGLEIKSKFPTSRIVKPIATYEDWIKSSNFKVVSRQVFNKSSNPAILPVKVLDKIIANTWGDIEQEIAMRIMAIDEVIYILEPS